MGALQNGGLALPLNLCKGRWRRRLFSLGQAGSCWWQLQPRCFSGEEICSSWCRWGDGNRNLRRGLQAGSLNPERSVTQSPVKLRKNFACVLWSFAGRDHVPFSPAHTLVAHRGSLNHRRPLWMHVRRLPGTCVQISQFTTGTRGSSGQIPGVAEAGHRHPAHSFCSAAVLIYTS